MIDTMDRPECARCGEFCGLGDAHYCNQGFLCGDCYDKEIHSYEEGITEGLRIAIDVVDSAPSNIRDAIQAEKSRSRR